MLRLDMSYSNADNQLPLFGQRSLDLYAETPKVKKGPRIVIGLN